MTQPTNTFDTYDSIGEREDLVDYIYDISPVEVPFLTLAARGKATGALHEWQTDALEAAVTTNKVVEGDDVDADAAAATTRLGNYTQLSDKAVSITSRQDAVSKAGRKSEMAYQVAKRARALKRDMESVLTQNQIKAAGNSSTASALASLECWIADNDSFGAGGASPTGDGTDAPTDGTQRAFTEALMKTVIQDVWNDGGDPDCLMVGGFNKQAVSGFTGGSTSFDKSEDKKLVAAVDVYESDFGTIKVIPNRFQRSRSAFLLQKDMWAVCYLQPFKLEDLGKTGHSNRKLLSVEFTLEARNEKASGAIRDLTVS